MTKIIYYIKKHPEWWLGDFFMPGLVSLGCICLGIIFILIGCEFFMRHALWRDI